MQKDEDIFKGCKSIAIMGGTFNPVHYGHLIAAQEVYNNFNVDKIVFIPAGNPPHKIVNDILLNEHRYLMSVLAANDNPNFYVSRIELDRQGYTYSIDTVKKIIHGNDIKIFFIVGADALESLTSWKDIDDIFNLCEIIAVTRPGFNTESLNNLIKHLNNQFNSTVHLLEIPLIDISSTLIRERIASNKMIKYLVPDSVYEYIIKNKLYCLKSISDIESKVKEALTEKRYAHVKGVAEEAVKLAKFYGEDEESAYLAGILHDYAKELDISTKLDKCREFNIEVDSTSNARIDLTHGHIASEMAKQEFNICDSNVLNAIKNHTLGRTGMSLLEKIVFIADVIEPNRNRRDGVLKIMKTAYENLDNAVYLALTEKIEYTKIKNNEVNPISLDALKYYSKNK